LRESDSPSSPGSRASPACAAGPRSDTYTSRMSGGRRPASGARFERHGWRDFACASSSTTSRLNCGERVGRRRVGGYVSVSG